MREPQVIVLSSDEECASCGHLLPEGTIVLFWDADPFCSLPCLQQAQERWVEPEGIDYRAAHDQALAAWDEARSQKPRHFVLLYSHEEDDQLISSVIFAHPGFVISCIPALMEGMQENEPTVAPPPDREE